MDSRKQKVDLILQRVGRLSYLLLLLPVLTDWLEDGRLPSSHREWITEVVMTIIILGFIYLFRQVRKELQRRDALRHDLIQTVMHDLKTPLTTTIGSLSALLDSRVGGKLPDNQLLALALRGCRAQNELVDDIMDADQLETAEISPRRAAVSCDSLLAQARDLLAAYAAASNALIRWPQPKPGDGLLVDERLIKRVLVNLIHNAVKYSPRGGIVVVGARTEGPDFILSVRDCGPGIPPPQLNQLFHKFHRVEGLNQTQRKGMGLGLYFCRLAVNAHGGAIVVENAVGGGAVFTVRLPGAAVRTQSTGIGKEGEPCPVP